MRTELAAGGQQRVTVRDADGHKSVDPRPLGGRCVRECGRSLARQEGWHRQNEDHPTAAVWSRWSGVKNLDGPEMRAKFPEWVGKIYGMRHTATNHAMGDGWWAWFIPLKGGDVSVGLVYDQRYVTLPPRTEHGRAAARIFEGTKSLRARSLGRRTLAGGRHAFPQEPAVLQHDVRGRTVSLWSAMPPGLSIRSYSPGMDWIAYTASAAADGDPCGAGR